MADINAVVITGRLTADPIVRKTGTGMSVANFAIADERQKAKGEAKPKVDFIDCVAWGGTADFIEKFALKGAKVAIDGRLQASTFKDRDDRTVKKVEVLVREFKLYDFPNQAAQRNQQTNYDAVAPTYDNDGNPVDVDSDTLPF